MEYNNPSEIVKNLSFGQKANSKIMRGVDKLAKAVANWRQTLKKQNYNPVYNY